MLPIQLVQLEHSGIVIALVAVGVAQVVADRSFLRSQSLGFLILDNGFSQFILFVQNQRQVGARLPESWIEMNGLPIGADGSGQVSVGIAKELQVVIRVWFY